MRSFDGEPGHEFMMIYEGEFADESLYGREEIAGRESQGEPIRALWKPIADFAGEGAPPLYPEGLLDILARAGGGGRG